jgi:hypothetical protein
MKEADTFNDIIIENFVDTYHNLTLKSIAMLKWITLTCYRDNNTSSLPQHVLKVDDDIFVNVEKLFNVIRGMPGAKMM